MVEAFAPMVVEAHVGVLFGARFACPVVWSGRKAGPNRAWSVTCPVGCCTSSVGIMARVCHKPPQWIRIAKPGRGYYGDMKVGTAAM